MGGFLSGVLGTNSQVGVSSNNPYDMMNPWVQQNQDLANTIKGYATGGDSFRSSQIQLMKNAQAIAQQQAQANAANRALSPGLAARLSGNQAAQLNSRAAADASVQQIQQQLGSQQLLAGLNAQQQHNINQASAINAGVASGNQQQAGGIVGGILGGAGTALAGMYRGGMVPHMAEGGMAIPSSDSFQMPEMGSQFSAAPSAPSLLDGSGSGAPQSSAGKFLKGFGGKMSSTDPMGALQGFLPLGNYSRGGPVAMKMGGDVPGKPQIRGDSMKNDTVKAMLSPGEIVIPNHITEAKDAPKKAAAFVAAVLAKKGRMK